MAGFFGFFDYTKPGKGVNKDEPPKPRFLLFFELFFRKFWKIMQLNFLFVITSIPMILLLLLFAPVGASVEGQANLQLFGYEIFMLLYLSVVGFGIIMPGFTYVMRNFARERHAWVFSDYFEHIKKNLKTSAILMVIDLAVTYLMSVNIQFYANNHGNGLLLFAQYLTYVFIVAYFIMHFYIYQIMVTFDMKLSQILRNALIFTFAKLPMNLLILVIMILIGMLVFGFGEILGIVLCVLIIPSLLGFLVNFYVERTIRRYMMPPEEEEIEQLKQEGLLDDNGEKEN